MFGIDVSHWQNPASLPWARFNAVVDFVLARACYGSKLRDRHCVEHVSRARAIGAKVGLYHFFRPSQPWREQWDLLRSVADAVHLGTGDIVPALDIERDPLPEPGTNVSVAWSNPCRDFAEAICEEFGDCMIYITQREFKMLGSPAWVLQRPLWIAHYTGAAKPASPGNLQPTIWQYRVGKFDPNGPGGYDRAHPELDHDRALKPLPLIGAPSDEGLEDLADHAALQHGEHDIINADLIADQVALGIDEAKREFFGEPDPEPSA
jgi:hypothetical protein